MDFIDDFIEEYKKNPCLWKASSSHFKNRIKRQEAYNKLINIAAKHGEHYNVERTKQKINNLRCAFRHQLKKFIELKGEKDEPYCPKRRYFESLMFLRDEENSDVKQKLKEADILQNLETKNSSESEVASDHNDSISGHSSHVGDKINFVTTNESGRKDAGESEELKKPCKHIAEANFALTSNEDIDRKIFGAQESAKLNPSERKEQTESAQYFFEKELPIYHNRQDGSRKRSSSLCSQPSSNSCLLSPKALKVDFFPTDIGKLFTLACKGIHNNTEDNFSNFGKIIAHKLRSMDATQAIFAEKIITDVLFQGQMKLLSALNINQFLGINCSPASCSDMYTGK